MHRYVNVFVGGAILLNKMTAKIQKGQHVKNKQVLLLIQQLDLTKHFLPINLWLIMLLI